MSGISQEERRALLRAIKDADANFTKGMYALAEPTYRKGAEFLGDGTPEITTCLTNLAHICVERKDFAEALSFNIRLLLLFEERFGEDHSKTITLMDEIAALYEKLGRSEESRDMFERARKASERSLWADQSNEPETTDGGPGPVEISDALDLGYQYSNTAKSNLDIGLPKPGQVEYEFGATAGKPTRELAEETMKLPKLTDDMQPKPVKDPQLETLIMSKADFDAQQKNSTKPSSDILKRMKTKLSQTTEPLAPTETPKTVYENDESPEVIGMDAIPQNEWKADAALSKVILNDGQKTQNRPRLVEPEESASAAVIRRTPNADSHSSLRPGAIPAGSSSAGSSSASSSAAASSSASAASPRKKPGVTVKLFQSKKQQKIILGVVAGCFLILLFASLFTSHANSTQDFENLSHRYRTVDGEKLFFLTSPSECEFVAGSETAKMPYYQFHGDFLDTCRVLFGPLLHHPHWLEKSQNTIKDSQGSTLYAEGSPELTLNDFAEEVGRAAQMAYLRTHHYPSKLEELDANKRVFQNPYTGQADKVVIVKSVFGKKSWADDGGVRKKAYDTTISGARYPNEPKRHAGAVTCYSAVVHTKKGDINIFHIRVLDKSEKPFIGSQPDRAHAIILENGSVKTAPRPHLTFAEKSGLRPHRAWLMPVINSQLLLLWKYGAAIIFVLIAVAAWVISTIASNQITQAIARLIVPLSFILAIIYALGDIIP